MPTWHKIRQKLSHYHNIEHNYIDQIHEQALHAVYSYMYTIRAEISAVCKFRGFHGHLQIQ